MTTSSHKQAIEKIREIENLIDVTQLRQGDLRVWPLIRLELWRQSLQNSGVGEAPPQPKSEPTLLPSARIRAGLTRRARMPLQHLAKAYAHRRPFVGLRRYSPADLLFFSRAASYNESLNGKLYDRVLDPFHELARGHYETLKLEMSSPQGNSLVPRYEKAIFVKENGIVAEPPAGRFIEGFQELKVIVSSVMGPVQLSEQYFSLQADQLRRRKDVFVKVLSHVQPKAVFMTCYYDDTCMALIWACRQLGIESVDVQHGKQGKYHGLYTHWLSLPTDGYDLLPGYFWVWGSESEANISSFMPSHSPHKAIVGGNLWLSKWKNDSRTFTDKVCEDFLVKMKRFSRVVLVSLQPMRDPLPAWFIEAMDQAPKSWLWLLRLHPQMRKNQAWIDDLHSNVNCNFDVDNSSSLPLYFLLKHVDYHVTSWSTVCYEALAFGVHTVIIHKNGRDLFKDYIDKELFSYAEAVASLIDVIKKEKGSFQCDEKPPYIETSSEIAIRALREIALGGMTKFSNKRHISIKN